VNVNSVEEFHQWTQTEQGKLMSKSFRLICQETRKIEKIKHQNVFDMFIHRVSNEHPECLDTLKQFSS
jgi:hypothetical protein